MQPAQTAALERDHARPAQVSDPRHFAARVGTRDADAGAQREHATLGPRHARQAPLEAQDGVTQRAVTAARLGGGAPGQADGGPASRAGARARGGRGGLGSGGP
jgi:hypothetical protein